MSYLKFSCLFLIFIVLLLSSCSHFSHDEDPIAGVEDIYEGIYYQGIEDSWFKPCIEPEKHWVFTDTPDSFNQILLDEYIHKGIQPVYMKLRGTPLKKSKLKGFFITYDRGFKMDDLIEIREAQQNQLDCTSE